MVLYEDGLGLTTSSSRIRTVRPPARGCLARRQLFCGGQRLPSRAMPAPGGADDSASVLFTSGTSGAAEGRGVSFRELLSNAEPTADGLTSPRRTASTISLFNWCRRNLERGAAALRGRTLISERKFSRSRSRSHPPTRRDHRDRQSTPSAS